MIGRLRKIARRLGRHDRRLGAGILCDLHQRGDAGEIARPGRHDQQIAGANRGRRHLAHHMRIEPEMKEPHGKALHLQPLSAETVEGDDFGGSDGLGKGFKGSGIKLLDHLFRIFQRTAGKLRNREASHQCGFQVMRISLCPLQVGQRSMREILPLSSCLTSCTSKSSLPHSGHGTAAVGSTASALAASIHLLDAADSVTCQDLAELAGYGNFNPRTDRSPKSCRHARGWWRARQPAPRSVPRCGEYT
jgi:hypothetical protein